MLQETIFLSTIEVEYIVVSHASKDTIWLKGLLCEFGRMKNNVIVFCNGQSVIYLHENPNDHNKTKNIDIKHHVLRQIIDGGEIDLQISSHRNVV